MAHNVSVIAVQAGAARATAGDDPHRATETLGLIERTARATLAELRALLGILRREGRSAAVFGPQPTMEQLGGVVARAREAGLGVDVRVAGPPEFLMPGRRVVRRRVVPRNPPGHRPRAVAVGPRLLPIVLIGIGLVIVIEGGAFGL